MLLSYSRKLIVMCAYSSASTISVASELIFFMVRTYLSLMAYTHTRIPIQSLLHHHSYKCYNYSYYRTATITATETARTTNHINNYIDANTQVYTHTRAREHTCIHVTSRSLPFGDTKVVCEQRAYQCCLLAVVCYLYGHIITILRYFLFFIFPLS